MTTFHFCLGQVTDVYVPSPFRHFAFVQFSESKVAQSLLGKEHIIKEVSVKIGEASPKGREQGGGRDHDRGGNRFGGYDGGYGRVGGDIGGFGNPAQQGGFSGGDAGGYGNSGPSWGMGGPS